MKRALRIWLLLFVGGLSAFDVWSQEIRLASIFSDHAVIQADLPVEVWGWAKPNSLVSVTFGESTVHGSTDQTGRFSIVLKPFPSSFQPRGLIVTSGDESIVREDLLVGEVWLAAGQSNMVWELEDAEGGREESIASNDKYLRLFEVSEDASLSPQNDVSGEWIVVHPRAARRFSAVGYFFGKHLRENLDSPVGIIQVAYGGTRIEAWIPKQIILNSDVFESARLELEQEIEANKEARRHWAVSVQNGLAKARASTNQDDWLGAYAPPIWPGYRIPKNTPAALYNAMLSALIDYPSRGMIWYQGESNRDGGAIYARMLELFIASIRASTHERYPVGIVQIAPVASEAQFPEIWQAQLSVARADQQVGLVVTTDLAELKDIHPRRKRQVGQRLGDWAMATVYGDSSRLFSGPVIRSAVRNGGEIRLDFLHASGLQTLKDGPLSGFLVRSRTDQTIAAQAEIVDDFVLLSFALHPGFVPCSVEYQMTATASPTLTNHSRLPASPFKIGLTGCEQEKG